NLGRYLIQKTGREMICWNGVCVVHETFSERRILALREQHPKALLLAHPECEDPILRMADFIGSTTALLRYSISSSNDEFIIATESGI
ncbi:quinolinate synthase NadA, partial [Listeria monocytogenes]|uniref:quinolinate synthase NadA n=1 Tax=Listeria monocytogenes TaxID=1639 RepID=UPI003C6D96E4